MTREKESAGQTEPASTSISEYTVRRAMRSPVYWLFVVWMTVRSAAYSLVIVHFVPMMVWKGLSRRAPRSSFRGSPS